MWILFLILFLLSFGVNLFAFFYIKHLFKRFMFDGESLEFIKNSLEALEGHLGRLLNLQVYIEDETVKGLVAHVKSVIQDIRIFKHIYELVEDAEIEDVYSDELEEDFVEFDEEGNEILNE